LALGIWVKTLAGSNAAAGLVFFVLALQALLAPRRAWWSTVCAAGR
jgi:hypothetical protein